MIHQNQDTGLGRDRGKGSKRPTSNDPHRPDHGSGHTPLPPSQHGLSAGGKHLNERRNHDSLRDVTDRHYGPDGSDRQPTP